jgi:molybdenum cofactor cytidylyltransferase
MESSIGLIILAAGASTRMGTAKQLLLHRGQTLIRRAAGAALASVCRPVVVVLGADAERVQLELEPLPIQVAVNHSWSEGMSSSIRVGLETLIAGNDAACGVVIMLCDQPFVTNVVINELVKAHRRTGKSIVGSAYGEVLGVPAFFGKELFAELATLTTGEGARQIIANHSHNVAAVYFPEGAVDVDTPQQYERLQAGTEFLEAE